MIYEVWALRSESFEKLFSKAFTRYQDARRYAKELASKNKDYFEIWIEGYERVLNCDLKF